MWGMKTSQNGRRLIEAFEGLFLTAYRDSVNVLTIGYGHTTAAGGPPVSPGQRVTRAEADQLLADDLARVERSVEACIDVPLKQCEVDALVSFEFNTGKLHGGTLAGKINNGRKAEAMQTLLEYNHAGGKVLRGLTRRRHAEKLMFEGDVAGALALAGTPEPAKIKGRHVVAAAGAAGAAVHVAQNGFPPAPVLILLVLVAAVAGGVYIWRNVLKKNQPEAVK